jgi:NAD(P)-dependent dehydrogenase (short-subunit alcohol dehydrogenase family)
MLAFKLAEEGCEVAISDINESGLKETKKMVESRGATVSAHLVDVADREQVYRFADDVAAQHGGVDMIINNAGVAVSESVEDITYEDFQWLFGINFWGVVYGTKAFLPYLKKRPEGPIVNISSVNGFITWPNHSPYCAAKFAVKGFTEVLLQEMRETNIRVSCVHPGGIKTNIARSTRFYKSPGNQTSHEDAIERFDQIARTTADKAAEIIISGIKKNKRRILVGLDAHIMDWLTRLFPVQFVKVMAIAFARN